MKKISRDTEKSLKSKDLSDFLEGMQAGVGAVIASVTVDMGAPIVKEKDPLSLIIMAGAFIAACVFGINRNNNEKKERIVPT